MGQQNGVESRSPGPVGSDWPPGRAVHLSQPHVMELVISSTALLTSLLVGVALWPVPSTFWLYPGGMAVLFAAVSVHAYFGMLRRHRDYLLQADGVE